MAHRVAAHAEADLDQIWDYIVQESGNPSVAHRFIHSITERFFLLATHPHMGRQREGVRSGLRSFPVLRVVHGRREMEEVFDWT